VFDCCLTSESYPEFIYEICGKSADILFAPLFVKIAFKKRSTLCPSVLR